LAPIALIFFAYKADEVTTRQAEIAEMQETLMKQQNVIQNRQIVPSVRLLYQDDDPDFTHDKARLTISNIGGQLFHFSYRIWTTFQMSSFSKPKAMKTGIS
jgi:hypothetical protein